MSDFIVYNRGEKEYRLLPIFKLPAEEMARILEAIFDQSEESISTSSNIHHATSDNSGAKSTPSLIEMGVCEDHSCAKYRSSSFNCWNSRRSA